MKQAKKHAQGFTLVELMIVVVIISILSVIALPAYTDYMMKGKIPDATSNLAATRVKMEQYFQDNIRYTTTTANSTCGAALPANTSYFTFSCTATNPSAPTPNTYTITATGTGSMAGFTYTIDQANTKATTAAPAGWGPTSATCWVTGKGGKC